MTIKWLGTTAIALLIGTGAVIAQSPQEQKREEGPRAQTPPAPSKDADRPAAGEERPAADRKDRAARPEPKAGAKEPQRGEAASPAERTKQSQEQPGRGERPTQQSQDEQKDRDAKRPGETKQQLGRDEQPKQDNRAQDAKKPADAKQQQGQQQLPSDRNDQAAQPTPSTQQGARPGDTARDRQPGQNTGQTADQQTRRDGRASVTVNDQQRTQIIDRLRRERSASNENINIRVNVGERLPANVRPRPLPPDIVRIAPQYHDYEYTVVDNRFVIVDPRSREVVDIIDEPGSTRTSRVERDRVVISREERETLRQAARRMTTVGLSSSSGSASDSACLTLQPVPEELVRNHPEFSSYRYLAIGDQVVLVDPRQQRVVEVID